MSGGASFAELRAGIDLAAEAAAAEAAMRELFPLPRSITGPGLRATLDWIGERLPGLRRHEVATGAEVLDWRVPPEWRVREAWIAGPDGQRVADWAAHPLHLVGYSAPVRARFSREALDGHLHSLPEHPDWIPYRTSYWRETWGFCLPHRVREALPPGEYEVAVDSELFPGSLSYGELVLPGEEEREVLLSCHVCHPGLANDNLSSLAATVALARLVGGARRRLTYRFLWAPGTIGAIAWLAANRDVAERVAAGLVLANLGDGGGFTYKASRRGDAWVDRAVAHVLAASGESHALRPFDPWGYDERQFCSPGFDLPVGRLTRTPHGEYPEYHTSADDLDFVRPEQVAAAVARLLEVLEVLEEDGRYRNLAPYGEPQLGRRGLYGSLGGGGAEARRRELALLWVLNLSDGSATLLDVARRSGLAFADVAAAARALVAAGLLAPEPA